MRNDWVPQSRNRKLNMIAREFVSVAVVVAAAAAVSVVVEP